MAGRGGEGIPLNCKASLYYLIIYKFIGNSIFLYYVVSTVFFIVFLQTLNAEPCIYRDIGNSVLETSSKLDLTLRNHLVV